MHGCCRLLLVAFLAAGCSGGQRTGPEEVRWDRETCARCAMAVGDRHYAAQVRGAPAGERTRTYKFDDIGCAVVWLDRQPWKEEARTELWVTDHVSGKWIEARSATYIPGRQTPMDYGLGAQGAAVAGGMDFAQAREHVYAVEARKQRHGDPRRHAMDRGP